MSISDSYHPINCDDYDSLEIACQQNLLLNITLRNGDVLEGKANNLFSRKNIEYLSATIAGQDKELRLDHIERFSHVSLGTIIIRYD